MEAAATGDHVRLSLPRYDADRDKSLNFHELKFMMEKLGIPQTHIALKEMIRQVDEDHDGKICFREVSQTCSASSSYTTSILVPLDLPQGHGGEQSDRSEQYIRSISTLRHALRNRRLARGRSRREAFLRSQSEFFAKSCHRC